MARPQTEIDLKAVEAYAANGLNDDELAAVLGLSIDTIQRRKKDNSNFRIAYLRGRARANGEVSGRLMTMIREGNVTAAIWWEKTRKHYSDRNEIVINWRERVKQAGHDPDELFGHLVDAARTRTATATGGSGRGVESSRDDDAGMDATDGAADGGL